MVRRFLVACALLAGCGRFGFGSSEDGPDAAPGSDAAIPLAPRSFSTATFSTTSVAFVDIPGAALTIPPSPGTSWLLLTTGAMESPVNLAISVEARYLVDGVEAGMGGTQTSTPGHPGPWQSVAVIVGTSAPHEVSYQLREATGALATLDRLDVVAVPLPVDAVHYAAADPPQDVTSMVRAPHTTLSLGALSGDYVFLVLVDTTDTPGLANCFVEWGGPSGEVWLAERQQPRESWQSMFAMQRATVDVASAEVTLYAHVGGNTSQVRDVRAVAIRADAFASIEYVRSDTYYKATTPTPVTMLTMTPAASAAARFVALGSMQMDEDCFSATDAFRDAHFIIDGADTMLSHATDNCAYAASYGQVQLLPTEPQTLDIAISSGNSLGVEHLASELMLLGLASP